MKKNTLIISLLVIGLISCVIYKDNNIYIGNFQENEQDFFESFRHNTDKEYYSELPFGLKYGGINQTSYDTTEQKGYTWLRNPKNLLIAFNTIKSIGIDKFISKKQYNDSSQMWNQDNQWYNKSLNQIVLEFIKSDTSIVGDDYYSKFWARRKVEGNLSETFSVFKQINEFYNGKLETKKEETNEKLKNLLEYDLLLINSDYSNYANNSIKYFNYLKTIKLDYSAYKLLLHNDRIKLNKQVKDSLLKTIKYDTLTRDQWELLNDNNTGWISWEDYHDPNQNYGP